MSHFIAQHKKYPQFSFAVAELRPLLNKKGRGQDSTVVRFENGILDTKAQHWTADEAKVIRQKLDNMYDVAVSLAFNDDQQEQQVSVKAAKTAPAVQVKG